MVLGKLRVGVDAGGKAHLVVGLAGFDHGIDVFSRVNMEIQEHRLVFHRHGFLQYGANILALVYANADMTIAFRQFDEIRQGSK